LPGPVICIFIMLNWIEWNWSGEIWIENCWIGLNWMSFQYYRTELNWINDFRIPFQYYSFLNCYVYQKVNYNHKIFGLITGLIWVDSWIFIWSMNFLLMYFKIPYDFTILRSIFTIRVCIAFFVPCQNHDFNNLDYVHAWSLMVDFWRWSTQKKAGHYNNNYTQNKRAKMFSILSSIFFLFELII
jgi:hypothetical protein